MNVESNVTSTWVEDVKSDFHQLFLSLLSLMLIINLAKWVDLAVDLVDLIFWAILLYLQPY